MAQAKTQQAHIADVLKAGQPVLSFEFFPPKTPEGFNSLFESIRDLKPLAPAYVSVTYGAGGSTRQLTHDLVVRLAQELNITVVPHLTCVGAGKDEIRQILERYAENGIQNIMALRGDAPRSPGPADGISPRAAGGRSPSAIGEPSPSAAGGSSPSAVGGRSPSAAEGRAWQPHPDGFLYAAELVAFIKKHFPQMGIGVAGFPEGHPDTPNRLKEIDNLKAKVDAGADYICTQLFFDNRDYYDFRDRCALAGITVPIIAGIMPVTSRKGMQRMAELSLGMRFPAKLLRALARAADDQSAENVGIHWATEQVRDLIDNAVPGIHFYTLNKSKATLKIYQSLGIKQT